jgi:DeoR family ulaG and ulaABCDEF operon transcriptional repressor
VQYWQADHLFMGAHWLSSQGVMEADPLLIQAGRRLIPQAQHVTVLADSSKFGGNGGMLLCGLERISRVITDSGVRDSAVRMLEQAGVEVLVVDPETPTKRTSHEGTQSLAIY